jgi:hypothetical protein
MGFVANDKEDCSDDDYQKQYDEQLLMEEDRKIEFEKNVALKIEFVEKIKHSMSEDDFLRTIALIFMQSEEMETEIDILNSRIGKHELALGLFSSESNTLTAEMREAIIQDMAKSNNRIANALVKGVKLRSAAQGRKGGKAKDVNTGSHQKRENIREIWATGRYTSRDICAEQECAALNMSFSTARKALRGTPEPA